MLEYTNNTVETVFRPISFDSTSHLRLMETAHDPLYLNQSIVIPPTLCFLTAVSLAYCTYGTLGNTLQEQGQVIHTSHNLVTTKVVLPAGGKKLSFREARQRARLMVADLEAAREEEVKREASQAVAWEILT